MILSKLLCPMAIGFVSFILEGRYFPLPQIVTYFREQLCPK